MSQGTPASSQIIALEKMVEDRESIIDAYALDIAQLKAELAASRAQRDAAGGEAATNYDLELARAVFPYIPWVERAARITAGYDLFQFDPNGCHFADVLAWLLDQDSMNNLNGSGVDVLLKEKVLWIAHDCSQAGIKDAVYLAAITLIKERFS